MENLTIRRATLDDCGGITNVYRNETYLPWAHLDSCRESISVRTERGFYIQITEIDGKIIGHGEWIVDKSLGCDYLFLGMLQIDDDYQRRDIGRAMMADGERHAAENGCDSVALVTEDAAEFYAKCGYAVETRVLMCKIPTTDALPRSFEVSDGVPKSVLSELPFVLGTTQASPRHMWELCNHKAAVKRETPTIRLSDGGYAQLNRVNNNPSAMVLVWSENLTAATLDEALSFGKACGLAAVDFYFFEQYAHLFNGLEVVDEGDVVMAKQIR